MIEESIGPIIPSSSFYETEAWGKTDQEDFINIALEVEHYKTPNQLLDMVNDIEDKLGRVRSIYHISFAFAAFIYRPAEMLS